MIRPGSLEGDAIAWKALMLWLEWFEQGGDPFYASEINGDLHCFFCGEWQPSRDDERHEPDCIYTRIRKLIPDDDIDADWVNGFIEGMNK